MYQDVLVNEFLCQCVLGTQKQPELFSAEESLCSLHFRHWEHLNSSPGHQFSQLISPSEEILPSGVFLF